MENNENKSILDQIAEQKNIKVDDSVIAPTPVDKADLAKKIIIAVIVVVIYAGLMVGLFTTKNLLFLIGVLAYIFLSGPFIKLLRKIFKVKDKNADMPSK